MSGSADNDQRSSSSLKIYPMDLASPKLTIVKSTPSNEMKVSQTIITDQAKTITSSGPHLPHTGLNLVRTTQQLIPPNIQPSSSVGSAFIQNPSTIQNSKLMTHSQQGQFVSQIPHSSSSNSPNISITQTKNAPIINVSQPTLITANQLNVINTASSHGTSVSQPTSSINAGNQALLNTAGAQLISVSQSMVNPGQQVTNQSMQLTERSQGNLASGVSVSGSSLRNLIPGVRLLTPVPHYNARPALTTVSSNLQIPLLGKLMSTSPLSPSQQNNITPTNLITGTSLNSGAGTGHVPRGLAAGASLAIPRSIPRLPTPPSSATLPGESLSSTPWNMTTVRSMVYTGRPRGVLTSPPATPTSPSPSTSQSPQSNIITSVGRARTTLSNRSPANPILGNEAQTSNSRAASFTQRNYQHPPKQSLASVRLPLPTASKQQLHSPPTSIPLPQPPPCKHPAPYKSPAIIHTSCQTIVTGASPAVIGGNYVLSETFEEAINTHQKRALHQRHEQLWQSRAPNIEDHLVPAHFVPTIDRQQATSPPFFYENVPTARTTAATSYQPSTSHQYNQAASAQLENRTVSSNAAPRPSILRKRDCEGAPKAQKTTSGRAPSPWGAVMSAAHDRRGSDAGSTTVSAASSAGITPPVSPNMPNAPQPEQPSREPLHEISNSRKKPRKQKMEDLRQCDSTTEEVSQPSSSPRIIKPHKRSLLGAGWSQTQPWRGTALHFNRPSDVRPRPRKVPQLTQLASRRQVLEHAEGWKVHHLTAQMEELVRVESEGIRHLSDVLKTLEDPNSKIAKYSNLDLHTITELVKGTVQRSKIASDGIEEARSDVLKIFNHRSSVGNILSRQAEKRCFRKHTLPP